MKKLFIAVVAFGMIALTSCEKDEGKLPNIAFKTGAGYVSANDSVGMNDTLTIGINASKAEDKDVLKSFDVSKSLDGGAASSIYSETMTSATEDSYSKDIQVITRNVAGTEKYTFTVVNRDGLKGQVSLTLNVK